LVEDQGRVALVIGNRSVEGTAVRRKVLTLLCLLLTRPRFSATRDEVLDALWPEFDPAVALNSLNQTVYFLRRVIEPGYREDTSPGYLRHESDVIWLDRQLVTSRSQTCLDFIKALPPTPSPGDVQRLATMYQGPFALDFAYEEWAVGYRDGLHAAYLQVLETAIASDSSSGHFARGIGLARRALAVDPEAEQVELSLLRMLRLSGAHAAAAEQYEHYSTHLREALGVEAPPLELL
jgi:DNA-binding SARP family transcriptional activator